jgi:ligand-binding sensor domain-containing protein
MLFGALQKRFFYGCPWLLNFTLLVICLAATTARAELPPLKHLTIADGLPQNGINKITQDERSGFFWICTGGDLARFDGYGFTNFTTQEGLPSDRVLDFLTAREGDYWLATAGGLVKFTPDGTIYNRAVTDNEAAELAEKPTFITYPPPDDKIKTVSKLLQDSRGTIWVGTGNGLFRLEKSENQFKLMPIEIGLSEGGGAGYVYALYKDRRGAIWIGAENSLHRISPSGRVTIFTPKNARSFFQNLPSGGEQPANLPDKQVFEPVYFRALLEDSRGNFWVGTAKSGLFQFTLDENEAPMPIRNLTTRKDSQSRGEVRIIEWIDAIVESFDGKLWVSGQGGLFDYDSTTGKFYGYTRRSGIAYHRYQTMFEDKNGNL